MHGRLIVVPESRELDLFARMLEAQGAKTLRCPMVTILDAVDPAPIEAWLRRFAAGKFDDLILLTGEGLRDRAYTWTASVFLVLAHEYLRE